ncbi:MAG: hypothetical protein AAGA90_20005 [Actinomycetota bacterium]
MPDRRPTSRARRSRGFRVEPVTRSARASTGGSELYGQPVEKSTKTDAAWQPTAYMLAKRVPPVRYPVTHLSRLMRKARVRIGIETETGDVRLLDPEDDGQSLMDAADRVRRSLRGPNGNPAEILEEAAYHDQVAGEFLLLGSTVGEQTEGDVRMVWEALSRSELVPTGKTETVRDDATGEDLEVDVYERRPDGGSKGDKITTETHYIARYHVPDREYSSRATSPVEGILDPARVVWAVNLLTAARADSQRASKILYVGDEVGLDPEPDDREEDAEDATAEEVSEAVRIITEHMTAAVNDGPTQAQLVPLIIEGPAEHKDAFATIDLGSEIPELLLEIKSAAIKDIALGLDVPPEIVEGKAGLNHWSAYAIDADLIERHLDPVAERLATFLTSAWLRPLFAEGEREIDDEIVDRLHVVVDLSSLKARADIATTARALYDRGEISRAAMLRANGFDETDAPDDDERFLRNVFDLIKAAPVTNGFLMKYLPGFEDVELPVAEDETTPAGGSDDAPPVTPDDTDSDPTSGGGEPTPDEPAANAALSTTAVRLLEAVDHAYERAIERAGTKLRTRARGFRPLRDKIEAADGPALTAVVPGDLVEAGIDVGDLLDQAWDKLAARVRRVIADDLKAREWDARAADEEAERTAEDLVGRVDAFARVNIHQPLDPDFHTVPETIVLDALAAVSC